MPSAEHESPVALAKLDPDLVAWLLVNLFDVKVPAYHHCRTRDTDVRVLVPRTYHADGMLLFCDETDQPLLAVVLEVQRSRDPTKQRTWKLYVAQLEAELARWEAFMTTTVGNEYRSKLLRELAAQHEELGEARGEGRAVLAVLDERGVPVSDVIREQILACTDLAQLDVWLRRAVTAPTADEVIRA
jgi:hypothetical protein